MPSIPEPMSVNAAAALSPAAALRERLTHGKGRLLVIIATTLVWVMDALLVHRIEAHHNVAYSFNPLLSTLERISTLAFINVTVGLAIALYRSRHQHLFLWSLSYLVISVNSTYGPTSEVPISRPAKLFMALQVLLAILMLTVLIARAVSA